MGYVMQAPTPLTPVKEVLKYFINEQIDKQIHGGARLMPHPPELLTWNKNKSLFLAVSVVSSFYQCPMSLVNVKQG